MTRTPAASRAARTASAVDAPEVRELARRRSRAAWRAASRRAVMRVERRRRASRVALLDDLRGSGRGTTGRSPVASWRRSTDDAAAQRGLDEEDALRRRRRRGAHELVGVDAGRSSRSAGSQLSPRRPVSSERSAFWSDSGNVRPIAITSPTDCICVPSTGDAPGQLLERPARDLGDDVVDRRLERRRRLAGDVVADLVEPVADRERAPRSSRSGSPVALLASALERDTRGFISMTTMLAVRRVRPRTGCSNRRSRRRCGGCTRTRRRACAGTRRR